MPSHHNGPVNFYVSHHTVKLADGHIPQNPNAPRMKDWRDSESPKIDRRAPVSKCQISLEMQVSSPGAAHEHRAKFIVSLFSEANEVHAQDNCQQLAFGIAPQAQCNVKRNST